MADMTKHTPHRSGYDYCTHCDAASGLYRSWPQCKDCAESCCPDCADYVNDDEDEGHPPSCLCNPCGDDYTNTGLLLGPHSTGRR